MIELISLIQDYIIPFIVVLTILVFFHELGHYYVARLNGVKVEVFSIGFGKEIFGWYDKHGTRWKISLLPLGGYVKMFGAQGDYHRDTPQEFTEEEKKIAFDYKSLRQRAAIVFAGPLANFILAIVLMVLLFVFVGTKTIQPNFGAWQQDNALVPEHATQTLISGDEIIAINGIKTPDIQAVDEVLHQQILAQVKDFEFEINRRGVQERIGYVCTALCQTMAETKKPFIKPFMPAIIEQVVPNSPASQTGLMKHDRILSLNHMEVADFYQVQEIIRANPDRALSIEYRRDGAVMESVIVPGARFENGATIGFIGVQPFLNVSFQKVSFVDAVITSCQKTIEIITQTLSGIYEMFTGVRSTEELGGPLRIAQLSGEVAEMGIPSLVMFMVLLSINLGLINLFPIPILDGGHLLLYGIEGVRGKPLSERMANVVMNFGLLLILMLFVYTTIQDILRLPIVEWFKSFF